MLLQGFTRVLERVCPVQPAAAVAVAATSAIYICSTLIHNLECGLNGMFASHSPSPRLASSRCIHLNSK